MFVKFNSVKEIKKYFEDALSEVYPENEIRNMLFLLFNYYKQWSKMEVRSNENASLSESELLLFHKAIKRLKKKEPIQYIIGETEFFSIPFYVSENVLIPRPETEELVDLVIKETAGNETILDIGTGSGCIPIAIKKNLPNSSVFGLDVSGKALLVAEQNAKLNSVEVKFIEIDILKINSLDTVIVNKLDVIISNPPYITSQEKSKMHENVLKHEPHVALFVPDNNPLLFYEKIGNLAFNKLKGNGKLYFEINESYGQKTLKLLKSIGFSDIRVIKDLQNKDRIIVAVR